MKTFLTSLAVSSRNHVRAGIGILIIALLSGSNNPAGAAELLDDFFSRHPIND